MKFNPIRLLLTFLLMLLMLSACSRVTTETPTPSETTNTAVPSPAPSESITTIPSPSLSPEPEKPSAGYSYITSSLEDDRLEISNGDTIEYTGNVFLTIYLTAPFKKEIKECIFIDNAPMNPNDISIGIAALTIKLDEYLPEKYTLKIVETDPSDENGLTEEFHINFIHHQALSCEITIADPMVQTFMSPPLYLSSPMQQFKFTFNKPVIAESLQFLDSMKNFNLETQWFSDSEMLLTISDLPLYGQTIGVKYVTGVSQDYGNVMNHSQRFTDPFPTDCTYRFMVSKRQNLYSIKPETNEMEILDDFDYGMVFEDASADMEYLSLGIITDEMEGWHYSKVIYNVDSGELIPLDTTLSESISKALGAEVIPYATSLYNTMVETEYWGNENNYHFFFGNSIFNIDPEDMSTEIYFSDYETNRPPFPVFHLENGSIAAIRSKSDGQINELWVIDSDGSSGRIYDIPFKMKTGEGWIHYLASAADAGDNCILVSGYEFIEGEENKLSTYLLDLDEGDLTLIAKGNFLWGYYSEPGCLIYSNYDDPHGRTIDFVSMDGSPLHTLTLDEGTYINELVYSSLHDSYYFKQYSESSGNYSISILDASSYEITQTSLFFESDISLIGVMQDGTLLALDMP